MTDKPQYQTFTVDLWVTDLHGVEIGIYQNSRHRAKSRQFTKDMDIFGEIKEDGERVGLLAFREKLWEKHQGTDRRLVIKLFTNAMNWKGTLDLMLGRSMQLSHGAGKFPVLAFCVNLSGQDHVVQLEKSAYQWVGFPEKFSFFVLKDGKPYFYRLRRDWIGIGVDYTLYDQNNKKIGRLDGKVIQLGGKWNVKIVEEHANAQVKAILQLFCAMLKFNDACRDHIRGLVGDMQKGHLVPALETHECDLYLNPRRMR